MNIRKIIVIISVLMFARVSPVFALDPTLWQSQATGLKTSIDPGKKTAGLSFIVNTSQSWPALSTQGGVYTSWGMLQNLEFMQLGQIKLLSGNGGLSGESADWAHNEMTFGSGSLKVTASRLSAGLLVETNQTGLRIFSGSIAGYTSDGANVTAKTGLVAPKYIAYSTGGQVVVKTLTSPAQLPTTIDNNWILVWWGNNSVYADTKKPLSYSFDDWSMATARLSNSYLADIPILLTFNTIPSTVSLSSEGGIDLAFSKPAGSLVAMPLFGREHPAVAQTETWANGLPGNVLTRVNFWSKRSCDFPTTVKETFAYSDPIDTLSITDTVTFMPVCTNGIRFSPLPPSVAMVRDVQNFLSFSGSIIDGTLPTEFGPIVGFDNTSSYTYQVKNLKRYRYNRRVAKNTTATGFDAMLLTQIQKFTTAGFLKPWFFADNLPRGRGRGDIYFLNPGEPLTYLSNLLPILNASDKQQAISYLRTQRSTYKPEILSVLPDEGTPRSPSSISDSDTYTHWQQQRPELFQSRVGLFNYYGLAAYYDGTGDSVGSDVFNPANSTGALMNTLASDLKELDFATGFPFKAFSTRRVAVEEENRLLTGLAAASYLTKSAQDQTMVASVNGYLARSALLRLAMGRYPRYAFQAGFLEYPASGRWLMDETKTKWTGFLFDYSWNSAADDPRQVVRLNQFNIWLHDSSGFQMGLPSDWSDWVPGPTTAHLISFYQASPEVMRLLADHGKSDALIYLKKAETVIPHWYSAYSEGVLGIEHNLMHPMDSYQLFMGKVFLDNASAAELGRYADVPWLDNGDFFYMDKLKEVILATRGWCWSDDTVCLGQPTTPTPACGLSGDLNCSGKVDSADLLILLGNFGKSGVGDINNSGKVDSADLLILLGNFGK